MDALIGIKKSTKLLARHESGNLLASLTDAGALARRILPQDDSSYVWSPIGSGLTTDPNKALEELYARFVAQYDQRAPHHRDDDAVWKPVRDKLAERNLADRLQPKAISSSVDQVEFEHAWKNGAWHCYQPLSFDLANEDTIRDKALKWAGHMTALQHPSEKFKPYFLVGYPNNSKLVGAYKAAIGILKLSPLEPVVIEESDSDDLVRQIEREIISHDKMEKIISPDESE